MEKKSAKLRKSDEDATTSQQVLNGEVSPKKLSKPTLTQVLTLTERIRLEDSSAPGESSSVNTCIPETPDTLTQETNRPQEAAEDVSLCQDDTVKILIASDCHLGYKHDKSEGYQVNDTLITFEEILKRAKTLEVDMIILAGDLFHHSKPSTDVLMKCIELIRKYCLGTRKPNISLVNDPSFVLKHCDVKKVNYEDPHLNVSIPIFTIHGNHDDPSFGSFGTMDLLAATGLVNYISKLTDHSEFTVAPLIFQRGNTKVGLYGISYINDQKMSRALRDGKIKMFRPDDVDECFNILVLHQNRVAHSMTGYVPDYKWPNFLNLLIWGHEHECRIDPELIPATGYHVCQPGSPVATSLCEAEEVPKHIGILEINRKHFALEKLRLKTVRPYVHDTISVKALNIPPEVTVNTANIVREKVLDHIVNTMIPKAKMQLSGHPKQPLKPLIRLRVLYECPEEIFDTYSLIGKYQPLVANAAEMIVFRKESAYLKSKAQAKGVAGKNDNASQHYNDVFEMDEDTWTMTVFGNIEAYFDDDNKKNDLTVLPLTALNQSLNRYVTGGDSSSFLDVARHMKSKGVDYLDATNWSTANELVEALKKLPDEQRKNPDVVGHMISQVFAGFPTQKRSKRPAVVSVEDDEEEIIEIPGPSSSKRGRGKGRGSSRGRGRGASGSGKATTASASSLQTLLSWKQSAGSQRQRVMASFIDETPTSRGKSDQPIDVDDDDY